METPSQAANPSATQEAKFKTGDGKEWEVAFNPLKIRKLKEAGYAFEKMMSGEYLVQFVMDPMVLADFLWITLEDVAETRGVGREQFESMLDGETLEAAFQAVEDGVVNFTPAPRRSSVIAAHQKTLDELEKAAQHQIDLLESQEVTQGIKNKRDKLTKEALEKMLASETSSGI